MEHRQQHRRRLPNDDKSCEMCRGVFPLREDQLARGFFKPLCCGKQSHLACAETWLLADREALCRDHARAGTFQAAPALRPLLCPACGAPYAVSDAALLAPTPRILSLMADYYPMREDSVLHVEAWDLAPSLLEAGEIHRNPVFRLRWRAAGLPARPAAEDPRLAVDLEIMKAIAGRQRARAERNGRELERLLTPPPRPTATRQKRETERRRLLVVRQKIDEIRAELDGAERELGAIARAAAAAAPPPAGFDLPRPPR